MAGDFCNDPLIKSKNRFINSYELYKETLLSMYKKLCKLSMNFTLYYGQNLDAIADESVGRILLKFKNLVNTNWLIYLY